MTPLRTTYAVWELTLKCNLACSHCGSRAGDARASELSTSEALDLVHQMADIGIHEITLIGGEAFLRADWLEIASAIRKAGMNCTVTTGGYGISHATAWQMKQAGIQQVSVSIDGRETTHDFQRGRPGSWQACFQSLHHLRATGIPITCNTQINRLSAPELPLIYADILNAGCRAWQLQMTVPMGRAADHPELLLQPAELLDLFPLLAQLAQQGQRDGLMLFPGNNVGYYGPYERLLRNGGQTDAYWQGCQAGLTSLGIEADGTIKGCPSLPTAAYRGGNIRQRSLREIVTYAPELTMNQGGGTAAGEEHLWGFCRTCEYASLCRGGCSWTAHVFFDRRGNNPYCHHRALTNARLGRRERVILHEAAPGIPFDNGKFAIVEEGLNDPWPEDDARHFTAAKIQWNNSVLKKEIPGLAKGKNPAGGQ